MERASILACGASHHLARLLHRRPADAEFPGYRRFAQALFRKLLDFSRLLGVIASQNLFQILRYARPSEVFIEQK